MKLQACLTFLLASILFSSAGVYSQNADWTNYTASGLINSITDDENTVWACGWGGIALIDKTSGETSYFNKCNSGILNNYIWCSTADLQGNRWYGVEQYGLAKFDGQEWERFNMDNTGLPSNDITVIECDSNGVLWMATCYTGLTKFDGEDWTVFNTSNSEIPSNSIISITLDNYGTLWIGTNNGLATYNNNEWHVYNTTNSGLPGNEIYDVAIDDDGIKWICVLGRGLVKFDDVEWTVYSMENSELPDKYLTEVEVFGNDKWLVGNGTGGGLIKFDGTTWTVYNSSNSPLHNFGKGDLLVDNTGNVWLGTIYFGVAKFNGVTWNFYDASNSILTENILTDIDIDKESGNIWIADPGNHTNYGGGIVKIHNEEWTYYMIDDFVYNVTFENASKVWVGFNDGVAMLQNGVFTIYNSDNSGLPDYFVADIAVDNSGNKWFASEGGGLVKFDGTNWSIYNTDNSPIPDNVVIALAVDSDNSIWLGTLDHGLAHFDGESWVLYNTDNSGLSNNCVYSIGIDMNGDIWIGSNEGVTEFDGINWIEHYPLMINPEWDASVLTIAFDTHNNVWVGGNNGLAKFDNEDWEYFDIYNSDLPHNYVTALAVDAKNQVWIATDLGGIAVYDQDHTTSIISIADSNSIGLQVYPNPVESFATIALDENLNSANFSLFDQTGKLMKHFSFSGNKLVFSRDNLAAGIYFYKIVSDTGIVTTGKIVVN